MLRSYYVVDVFSPRPFGGNPVAVVMDATGLTDGEMQRYARWTNLSETTFVLPPTSPEADYRVRIFTLSGELPFAGHPTLGTCRAWLTHGGTPRRPDLVVQECGIGLVEVRLAGDRLAFAAPPLRRSGPVEAGLGDRIATILGVHRAALVEAEWVDNGPPWVGVLLESAEAVLALEPDFGRDPGEDHPMIGVVGPHRPGAECAYEVRAFLGDECGRMIEDPVTGSLNASLAQWLLGTGRVSAPYVASQGTRLGRMGRVRVEQDEEGTVWIGGDAIACVRGEVDL